MIDHPNFAPRRTTRDPSYTKRLQTRNQQTILNPSSHPAPPPDPTNAPARDSDYSREVVASWAGFLGTLPAKARILDIGVGNHVPALIAARMSASEGRDWRIEAIDPGGRQAGASTSVGHALEAGIGFHASAEPAQLPFDEAGFDAVCGHHVLEFNDAALVLAAVHHALKPGGSAQFLLHHADSPMLQGTRISLREADLVFTRTKAFRRVHRLVTMSQIVPGSTERATNEVRMAIRTLKRSLPIAQRQGGGRVLAVALDAIQKTLAARRELRPDAAGLAVDRAETELRASVRRLGSLMEHARTDADMEQLEQVAASAGFAGIERTVQWHVGEPVAWQLLMRRA